MMSCYQTFFCAFSVGKFFSHVLYWRKFKFQWRQYLLVKSVPKELAQFRDSVTVAFLPFTTFVVFYMWAIVCMHMIFCLLFGMVLNWTSFASELLAMVATSCTWKIVSNYVKLNFFTHGYICTNCKYDSI